MEAEVYLCFNSAPMRDWVRNHLVGWRGCLPPRDLGLQMAQRSTNFTKLYIEWLTNGSKIDQFHQTQRRVAYKWPKDRPISPNSNQSYFNSKVSTSADFYSQSPCHVALVVLSVRSLLSRVLTTFSYSQCHAAMDVMSANSLPSLCTANNFRCMWSTLSWCQLA